MNAISTGWRSNELTGTHGRDVRGEQARGRNAEPSAPENRMIRKRG